MSEVGEVEGCYNSMGIALDMNTALPSLNTALDLNWTKSFWLIELSLFIPLIFT